jgi:hypothetical protein
MNGIHKLQISGFIHVPEGVRNGRSDLLGWDPSKPGALLFPVFSNSGGAAPALKAEPELDALRSGVSGAKPSSVEREIGPAFLELRSKSGKGRGEALKQNFCAR